MKLLPKPRATLSKSIICVIIVCLTFAPCFAQTSSDCVFVKNSEFQFSLCHPSVFKAFDVGSKAPGILLALQEKEHGFPSFNIVFTSKSLQGETQTSLTKELLHEYRLVGLTNVRHLDYELVSLHDTEAHVFNLAYNRSKLEFRGRVALIPIKLGRLIFTLTWPESSAEQVNPLWEELLAQFQLADTMQAKYTTAPKPVAQLSYITIGLVFFFLAFLVGLFYAWRWKSKAHGH